MTLYAELPNTPPPTEINDRDIDNPLLFIERDREERCVKLDALLTNLPDTFIPPEVEKDIQEEAYRFLSDILQLEKEGVPPILTDALILAKMCDNFDDNPLYRQLLGDILHISPPGLSGDLVKAFDRSEKKHTPVMYEFNQIVGKQNKTVDKADNKKAKALGKKIQAKLKKTRADDRRARQQAERIELARQKASSSDELESTGVQHIMRVSTPRDVGSSVLKLLRK